VLFGGGVGGVVWVKASEEGVHRKVLVKHGSGEGENTAQNRKRLHAKRNVMPNRTRGK